jgi:phospholipid/cholesterol/gamma-HCH transport system substrate-binding protein
VPSQQEVQWSQLKVGVLIIVALSALVALIFLMSGNTGGFFTGKLRLHAYFENSAGLKVGAPVNLDGVTIGNVKAIKIVTQPRLTPVEVFMSVSKKYQSQLHSDSRASLSTVGVLGDTIVDIDNRTAKGGPIQNGAQLPTNETPNLQDVIQASQGTIQQLNVILGNVNALINQISSGQGTIGKLISDPSLYNNLNASVTKLNKVATQLNSGQGTIGKLLKDPSLYNHLNNTATKIDDVANKIDTDQGTLGKLIQDPTLYNNLNQSVTKLNHLLTQVNSGQGALGMMVNNKAFANKLNDTVTQLDSILQQANAGKGTVGQLIKNPSLYNHLDQVAASSNTLVTAIRKNPKKYLVIHLKIF